MTNEYKHIPVLVDEVIEHLQPKANQHFFDGTVGGGGHARTLLEHTKPNGTVLGCDLDLRAVQTAQKALESYGSRAKVIQANYADVTSVLKQYPEYGLFDGIIVDLGLSSDQLSGQRGFSFKGTGTIDMRFDANSGSSASELLKSTSEDQLIAILKELGEVRQPRQLARILIQIRNQHVKNDTDITVEEVSDAVKKIPQRNKKIHPATQIFQALRITVNHELENIEKFLPEAISQLVPGGRIAVISFHSLEDRIVKQYFRREALDCLCPPEAPKCLCNHNAQLSIITKKPVIAKHKEIAQNARSRSALLRVAQKL